MSKRIVHTNVFGLVNAILSTAAVIALFVALMTPGIQWYGAAALGWVIVACLFQGWSGVFHITRRDR